MRKNLFVLASFVSFFSILSAQFTPGTGTDGDLYVLSGETAYTDLNRSAVTGLNSAGSAVLMVADGNAFQEGDEILIITMQDPELNMGLNLTGQFEIHMIQSVVGNQLNLVSALTHTYDGLGDIRHQVVRIPNYRDVTVEGILTCSAWNGTTGGVLFFRASGSVDVLAGGLISSNAAGYRGGTQYGGSHGGGQGGESFIGIGGTGGIYSYNNAEEGAGGGGAAYAYYPGGNGIAGGGGGGTAGVAGTGSGSRGGSGGGGAGHAGSAGGAGYGSFGFGGYGYYNNCHAEDGSENASGDGCVEFTGGGGGGGGSYGTADLSRLMFGSGGGRGGRHDGYSPGIGGNGGGVLFITTNAINCDGTISSNGGNGGTGSTYSGGGGGAAGGSLFLVADEINNNGQITTNGGTGGRGHYGNWAGNGGEGRMRIDANYVNNAGTINPLFYEGELSFGIFHESLTDTQDDAGPYPVEVNAYGEAGADITSASLFYSVDGGAFTEINLSAVRDTSYTGDIPGQDVNSTIDYYLYATDGIQEYFAPATAPGNTYSFMITGNPPTDLEILNNNNGSVTLNWTAPVDETNLVGYTIYRSTEEGFDPDGLTPLVEALGETTFDDAGLEDFTAYYYIVQAVYDYDGLININSVTGSVLVNDTSITSLQGYVFLQGQSNHSNIKVRFEPESPSAVLDSVYTNALGYFEFVINPGIYTVRYQKTGFQEYVINTGLSLIDDYDFGVSTITALGNDGISGNISGIWDGLYTITGNVTIQAGDSLFILPGSNIQFDANAHFSVNGYLEAVGTEADSIRFYPIPTNQILSPGQWQGIDFNDTSDDNSLLQYAVIGYAVDGVAWYDAAATLKDSRIYRCSDMGMELSGDNANPFIMNVETHHNSNHGYYVYEANSPAFRNINSHHNAGYGGYHTTSTYGSIRQSRFNDNSSHGLRLYYYASPSLDSCQVNNNGSWGMRIERYSSPWIGHTTIANNWGDGVQVNPDNNEWCYPRFVSCIIEDNLTQGIYFRRFVADNAEVTNCTIRNNGANGIYMWYYVRAHIEGNYIYNNRSNGINFGNNSENHPVFANNVIAYNANDGIYQNSSSATTDIQYNTIYGNSGDGIELNNASYSRTVRNNLIVNNGSVGLRNNVAVNTFEYNNIFENLGGVYTSLGNLPVNSWDFVSFNANADTADIYLNISEPAQFAFTDSLDFRLLSGSACINAGDPAVLDADGTASDIGAIPFDSGNPHMLSAVSYGDQSVTLIWTPVDRDSLVSYGVYVQESETRDFLLYTTTTDTSTAVNDLTNNQLYEFSVTSIFPNSESILSPSVMEQPGEPQISLDPVAFNFTVDADTVIQTLSVSNPGTRDLELEVLQGTDGGSVRFDGSGDYINMGDRPEHYGMDALTLESWVKRYNNGHFEFLSKHYLRYSMYINSNNEFGVYKGYDSAQSLYQSWGSGWIMPANEWHHLAVTWEGNILKFYVDGELIRTRTDAVSNNIPGSGYNLQFARRADNNNYYLYGNMCEARIWNKVRTQSEIQRYMISPLNGDEAGLVGYWPLHNDYLDYSIYGYNGTSYNQTQIHSDTAPMLPLLPFVIEAPSLMIEPGGDAEIDFKFYNTGANGAFVYTSPLWNNSIDDSWIDYEMNINYGTEVPSSPVHFISVAETGLPYTIVVTNAIVDETTIAVGDEIGIFDGNLCVGAGLFDGSFNLAITAWEGDDGLGLAGFTTGNEMTFKIFDTSADLEANTSADFSIGDGTFGYGQFSALTLNGTIYKSQEIAIVGGMFNLISFNILPRYTESDVIFNGLESLEIVYTDLGHALIPDYNINSIGDIDFRDGFHLFTEDDEILSIEGVTLNPMDWDITVDSGRWNSIAFLGEDLLDVTLALPDTLIDSLSIIQASNGDVWIPDLGVNTIINLEPGKGYQFALDSPSDIVFNYQTNNGLSKRIRKEIQLPEQFEFMATGIPYSIVIDAVDIQGYDLIPGDEIAVYNGENCVGAVVYDGSDRTLLTAWGSDETAQLAGFTDGEPMLVRVYIQQYDTIVAGTMVSLIENNPPVFGAGGYAHVSINGETPVPTHYSLGQNYPNPFNPVTSIQYTLPEAADVSLIVYDISGREVATLVNDFQQSGYYELRWSGTNNLGAPLASGVYIYQMKTDSFQKTKKMLLIK